MGSFKLGTPLWCGGEAFTSGATALPALSEELICADSSQWLRFCDEARCRGSNSSSSSSRAPVGLEDGQRYGVLNRKVVEVRRGVDDEGRDIAEMQIPLHTRLYIAWHCALGLRELHMRGIAHGDLCQANVLVDVLNRQCKLANFGLNLRGLRAATVPDHDGSVLDGEEIEETGGSGTPMALAADIYAFGVLLFEILALHAVPLETAVETVPFPEQLSGALGSGTPEGDKMKELIASCLDQHPKARPDIRSICQALERLILDALVPQPAACDIWKEAVALEATAQQGSAIGAGTSGIASSSSALMMQRRSVEDHLFGVSWANFERAFLRDHMHEDIDSATLESSCTAPPPTDHPHFNKILALYVIHQLIAEWDTNEALALSPVEIEERIRKWGLDDHLKGALSHVRQDVLLKRELTGRNALLDKVFALVADKNFQAVQTLDEAKLLLNDQPIGTFLLHFVRAVPGINEAGYCATWVEDKTPGEPTVYLGCSYFTRSENKWCLGDEQFSYLDELCAWLKRDKVLLLQPYRPASHLESLKLAWYAHQQAAAHEVTLGSGFTAARMKMTRRQQDEQYLKNHLHADARNFIQSAEATQCFVTRDGGLSMKMKRELIARSGYLLVNRNHRKWERRLVDLVEGFAVLYVDEHAKQRGDALEVIALEGFRVHIEQAESHYPAKLVLRGGRDEFPVLEMRSGTISLDPTGELQKWAVGIQYWAMQGFIHGAYVPVRRNINCRWFVDGRDAFYALAAAISAAQHNILLSSWRLVPEMYMRRIPPFREDDRFDHLLLRKAREGVKIYILLWKEPKVAMDHGSGTFQERLMNLHPNIKLMRHPHFKGAPTHPYSHHQKAMVVDYGTKHVKGFVGGMDVAFGRWDTDKHVITDENRLTTLWPGADYFHIAEPPFVDPFVDVHDRETEPRCGWHDIMMSVDGEAAVDLAYNFLQRWNHHRAELTYYEQFLPVMEAISPRFPVLKPLPNPFFQTGGVGGGLDAGLTPEQTQRLGGMAWAAANGRWRRCYELVNEQRFGCLGPDGGFEDPRDENAPNNEDNQHSGRGLLAKIKNFLKRPFSHHAKADDAGSGRASKRQHRSRSRSKEAADVDETQRVSERQHTTGELAAPKAEADDNDHTPLHSAVVITTVDETTGDEVTALSVPALQPHDRKGKGKAPTTDADHEALLADGSDPYLPELLLVPEQIQQRERERIAQLVIDNSGWDVNRILTEECRVSGPEPYTQMVRSMAMWSGANRKETSLCHAHFALINKAKHFIYIENQFFISRFDGGSGPQNAIGHALVSRIGRAARERQPFRVMILVPGEPAMGPLSEIKNRQIIGLQHSTIWKGPRSIFRELQRRFKMSFEEASKYISFHALRSHGHLFNVGPVTEGVYIHAKLLIIDDQEAIIGSANINDRSLDGYRDSELAAWVKDDDMVAGRMGGQPFYMGRFCHSLRMSLWKEHLGIGNDDKKLLELISDPVSEEGLAYWDHVAQSNTELYERVFPYMPQNSIQTLKEVERRKDAFHQVPLDQKLKLEKELKQVRGHLVNYALTFLEGEHLEISLTDSPQYIPFKTTFY
ncbi:phospholipase D active site domain containing protein [Acanthamoeba castellanii str. Neff]|uniref:phospholipase D n=1 Tax=Acanthamoeba castellanii (strain ATCC 30010 / Neff) TaxID=1257118 RepID=L8GM17_ACACF|nr:phospholipase D active site domain containing protein [Acanthamoeba castellanii str. Neff]ELR13266.1 phospholipase D active site domain containing protein [Acanthamoeba castellanii str. Neff]